MRKKQTAVLGMTVLFLTACASSPAGIVEPSEVMVETEELGTDESGTEGTEAEEEEQVLEQGAEQETRQDIQAQEFYEVFINEEYAGHEGYTYVMYDVDGDGCKELYITWGSSQRYYIFTYANGGLCIEYQQGLPAELDGLQWINTETLTAAQDREMVHSGIYVYVNNMGDTREPIYILDLDNCGGEWIPKSRKGK